MSYTIALAGKGGTGKTTLASLLVRILKEEKRGAVLAVDADPNSNLAESLGVTQERSIGAILDEIAGNPDVVTKGMPKDRFIEYEVQKATAEEDGFDIITMGRPEGPGCYCYVNNVLRNCMAKLINSYEFAVIDNEAGLEHLSRRTTRSAEALFIVSDATEAGLRAARRINELVIELKIKIGKKFLIINRGFSGFDVSALRGFDGVHILGVIPEDEEVARIARDGGSLMELSTRAQSLVKLKEMVHTLWQ